MATIALMLGGAVLNATAFIGGSYLAKALSGDDTERIRHDKALEKYQHDMGEWQRQQKLYQDWLNEQYFEKKQADENLQSTDQAFILYNKAHPSARLQDKPNFKNYYSPSEKQKQYELLYVGGGMLGTGYIVSKYI